MVFNRYAAGKKVYSSGSYAPTRGTVNPSGYIKREMLKRGDQSQNRSGLAQRALNRTLRRSISENQFGSRYKGLDDQQKSTVNQRLQRRVASGMTANKLNPTNKNRYQDILRSLQGNPGSPKIPKGKFTPKVPKKAPGPIIDYLPGRGAPDVSTQPVSETQPGSPDVSTQPVPYAPPEWMKINSNGQLDLPYDESFSWEMLNQKQAMNDRLLDLQQQEQMQAQDYQRLRRGADRDYTDLKRGTLNNYAGRGMAFSSGYGNAVAENSNDYNQFLNQLDTDNSIFQSGVRGNRAAIENAFNEFLRRAALERSLNLQDDAGELGYDTTPVELPSQQASKPRPTKTKPKPKPRPKKKGRR